MSAFIPHILAQGLSRFGFHTARQTTMYPLSFRDQAWRFAKSGLSGIIPSGKFGAGYVGGSYLTYGVLNDPNIDPLGVQRPKYKVYKDDLGIMPYRRSYYGRRSYYSRYGRRYRRRRSYRRSYRSYYRRRYY